MQKVDTSERIVRYKRMTSPLLSTPRMMAQIASLSLLLLLPAVPAHAQNPPPIKLWPAGAPGAKGDQPHDTPTLWVSPAAEPGGAAIVIFPGGGYGGLALDHEGQQIAQFYNNLGVTAFVLNYRLGSKGYHYPVELNDAKRAIRWVRANADTYGVDKARIGVIGFSAGGHLASMAGTLFDNGDPAAPDEVDRVSSRPDFLVLAYPVISLVDTFTHRGSRNNLLGEQKDNEELARQLSSQLNVTANTPPTFIFQTDEDTAVPAENAVGFYLALRKNKVPAEMHVYQRGPHGVGLMHGDPVLSTWGQHLTDWMRNNGWLRVVKRAAVEGTISVNGKPVSWGGVTFTPEDKLAPVMNARVMGGKFKLSAAAGAVIGKNRLTVTFSAADVAGITRKEAPEGVLKTSKLSAGEAAEMTVEIKEGQNMLPLELKWP